MIGGGGGSIDGRPHRPVARGAAARISPLSVEVALENIVLFVVRCSLFASRRGQCRRMCISSAFSVGTNNTTFV